MENFKHGGRKGGFRSGGARGFKERGNMRDARPMTMHSAICSSCRKPCEVPFRPTGEKPVYCRDCFAGRAAMGGERSQRRDERTSSYTPSRPVANVVPHNSGVNEELKRQIDSMNVKLDKLTNTIQNLAEKMNGTVKEEVVEPVKVKKSTVKIEEKMKKGKK